MAYINTSIPFIEHNTAFFDPALGYGAPASSFSHCNPPADPYLISYHATDFHGFSGFYGHSGLFEDYDEYVENLSRPRLTKEQVETLEAQFQAQPKPTSNVKRQLAVQTNLTLPRVANWFQNRRAKAKQQKRQEEFKRMQALKKSEETDQEDSSSSDPTKASSSSDEMKPNIAEISNAMTSLHPQSSKAPLELHHQGDDINSQHETISAMTTPCPLPKIEPYLKEESCSPLSGIPSATPSSWSVANHGQNSFNGAEMNTQSLSHVPQGALTTCDMWSQGSGGVEQPVFQVSYSTCDSQSTVSEDPLYANNEPFMQPFLPAEISDFDSSNSRRESCTSDQMELGTPANLPRRLEKKPDLAARRKQPRPAAIGITKPSRNLMGPSSMSPTAKSPAWVIHSLRHAKSSQTLGSNLGPRYGGIRKASAPLRSPLGMAASLDALGTSCASSDFFEPPLVAGSLAPPTPLTPDEMQYLVPPTPNDAQYCHSPTEDSRCQPSFSVAHSLDNGSPPITPQHIGGLSQPQYQQPVSTSTLSTTYTTHELMITNPWGDASSVSGGLSVPEIQMPKPTHVSPVAQQGTVPQLHIGVSDDMLAGYRPSSEGMVKHSLDYSSQLQQFPMQQQMKQEDYTFTHQTLNDF